jgi:hypothetical protein
MNLNWRCVKGDIPTFYNSIVFIVKDDPERKIHFGWNNPGLIFISEVLDVYGSTKTTRCQLKNVVCWANLNSPPSSCPSIQEILLFDKYEYINYPIANELESLIKGGIRI